MSRDSMTTPTSRVVPVDRASMTKGKIAKGLSDALGFAKGADSGERITITSASEFFVAGVRFNPGRYELRRVDVKRPRFEIIDNGPLSFVLVDNESDDPAPCYTTREEAEAAKRVAETDSF